MTFDVLTIINLIGQLGGDHKGAAERLHGRESIDPDQDAELLLRYGVNPQRLAAGGYPDQLAAQRSPAFSGYRAGSDPRGQIVRFSGEPGFAPDEGVSGPGPLHTPTVDLRGMAEQAEHARLAHSSLQLERHHTGSDDGHGGPSGRPVAVVTGASAGVGRATAVAFAERGFDVALLARGRAGLEAAAAEVEAKGVRALPLSVDVAVYSQVDEAAAVIEEQLGAIEVWVNDAMTTVFAPAERIAPEDFQRAVEVTFLGQVWGTKAALAHMRGRDRGTIVNIGSALAFIGIPLQSAYCASKFACRGFFESTRAELLHEGSQVRMCMVHLPAVNTPQFDWCETDMDRHPQPVPPIYEPEVCARFVVASALDGRRGKVIGSWNKLLVVAASLAPGFANQFAARAAWESQLTDRPLSPNRRANLRRPVDEDRDAGSRGIFSKKAGGFSDPSFLKTLPHTAAIFGRALAATVAERRGGHRGQLKATLAATATTTGRAASHVVGLVEEKQPAGTAS
jgi:NAD(P)-dependent dehydrogenase (short-subunit alcohol dehydrogenase family)